MTRRSSLTQATKVVKHVRRAIKNRIGINKDIIYSVDNPTTRYIPTRMLLVDGWAARKRPLPQCVIRLTNNGTVHDVKTGVRRRDVVKAFPQLSEEQTLYSGFSAEFLFEDGDITVEIDTGTGFKKVYSAQVVYNVESLPELLYNDQLSVRYPEHLNLLDNRKQLYYEDEATGTFVRHDRDPRLIATYLPQFHPFPENDKAWGKGFTEWTNVTTAAPRFVGHQQPILPKDLGFYDLRLESKIEEQITLAKKYGIYGFCFYYYWFSGEKLMDQPLETVLKHPEWDFNFLICWANENWTKRWDGRDNEVIIAQEYSDEDPLAFIKDVEHIITDPRYIREDSKPVLMVFRASELKKPAEYAKVWREYMRREHKLEIRLVSCLSFDDRDPREYGFDAGLDFAPQSAFFKNKLFPGGKFPFIDPKDKVLDPNFNGMVADYRAIALNEKLLTAHSFPMYQCVTPSWDNDARKKGKGFIYQNSSPDIYQRWLDRAVEHTTSKGQLVFVNAWNEWAEGAIMEPSMHLGHAVLKRTAEVLAAHSKDVRNKESFPVYGIARAKQTRLAVVVHLYYPDLWPAIRERLQVITEPYDLFVTLNARDRDTIIDPGNPDVSVYTYVVPNRGRDVLPFLITAHKLRAAGYTKFLKLHSKKSKHRSDGVSWFDEVLKNLLPNETVVTDVLKRLDDASTGLVGPQGHLVSLERHMGSNRQKLEELLTSSVGSKKAEAVLGNQASYPFFGGTMFWGRLDVLDPILDLFLLPDDYQSEHGQIDGTLAHAIERLFGAIVIANGKKLYDVSSSGVELSASEVAPDKYKFAP